MLICWVLELLQKLKSATDNPSEKDKFQKHVISLDRGKFYFHIKADTEARFAKIFLGYLIFLYTDCHNLNL